MTSRPPPTPRRSSAGTTPTLPTTPTTKGDHHGPAPCRRDRRRPDHPRPPRQPGRAPAPPPRRLGTGPYAAQDLRGSALRGANLLVPFHEVYATRHQEAQPQGQPAGLAQLSYIAFVSQARHQATGTLGHLHWWTYTEDPAGVPGKYRDATLAEITRSQSFTKHQRGQTQVRETFSAVAEGGQVGLSLAYRQGGMLGWVTADSPNLPLYAAKDPTVVRWYQEDQVIDVVHSHPLGVDRVSELTLEVRGELADIFDGHQRVVAVFIQRPYMRRVYEP
jgi:hypothetical protein